VPDRLPQVLSYTQQGCRCIACRAGTKHAAHGWERFQREDPTRLDLHRWWTGTRQNDANVALILGPPPGGNLLALNVNVKHGHGGLATLQRLGWIIPPTPTIRTPSGGLCHFFRVPDRTAYPFPFATHVYPDGYDGLEFRGAGGYQLVPMSRTAEGVYAFVPPWTLDRFRADLADLPGAVLQAWAMLDRGAKFSREIGPVTTGHAHKPALALAMPADLSTPSSPSPPCSHVPAARKATPTTPNLTTITTALSSDDYSDFEVGEVEIRDRECAEHLSRRFGLEVARLDDGHSMLCVLPGHRERTPSATWFKTDSGYYLYHDWHARSGDIYYPVPDVFAALVTGTTKSLPKPSRKTWRLRLMVEAGLLDPYPVEMKPFPDDMPKLLRHFCEGFRYLCACKWTYQERAPTMFTDAFAAGWCGIREGSIWKLRRLALAHGFIVAARDDQGRSVYLSGKEQSA
jgi:Bifunctional DNA primase/polymerase, N-terminal